MEKSLLLGKSAYVLIGLLVMAALLFNGCRKETPVDDAAPAISSDVVAPAGAPAPPATSASPAPASAPTIPQSDPAPAPASTLPPTSMESMMEAHMFAFKDGSYFREGAYQNPVGDDSITVQLKVENDRVTGVSIGLRGNDPTSKNFQQLFADGIGELVVGKSLDEIGPVGAVNGSSLTPLAFNRALEAIKAEARS